MNISTVYRYVSATDGYVFVFEGKGMPYCEAISLTFYWINDTIF